jgi:hypothetical protein
MIREGIIEDINKLLDSNLHINYVKSQNQSYL